MTIYGETDHLWKFIVITGKERNGGDAVTLITRPIRFGKTITMSMLNYFFSSKYAGKK